MINLLEEEYDAASGKYILHLTMGTEDTLSDLPSAEKPFNSSNYSCFFDYGEPAENSTAVDEESGAIYLYSNGEWIEPQPPVEAKIALVGGTSAFIENPIKVNGESPAVIVDNSYNAIIFIEPGDILSADSKHYWRGYDENGVQLDDTSSSATPQYIPSEGVVVVFVDTP